MDAWDGCQEPEWIPGWVLAWRLGAGMPRLGMDEVGAGWELEWVWDCAGCRCAPGADGSRADPMGACRRWCERTVLVTEQEEVTPRREAAVPCPSLYQYSLAGWRLDRDRTRREHGNSPGDTSTNPALCYIYR